MRKEAAVERLFFVLWPCVTVMLETPVDIVEILKSNWNGLAAAPWIFVLTFISATGAAYAACKWYFQKLLDDSKSDISRLKEQIAEKDRLLDDCRKRLGITPSSGNKFSLLTNKDLQEHVFNFVHDLRQWIAASYEKTTVESHKNMYALSRAKTEEERLQLWHEQTLDRGSEFVNNFEQYKLVYKVDAILYRDELLSRLRPSQRTNRTNYDPVNFIYAEKVADDLEHKAKQLD